MQSVFAAVYLTDAINTKIEELESEGFAEGLRAILNDRITDTSGADSCPLPQEVNSSTSQYVDA